ncbi:hypothetical protein MKW94_029062 [Papaver nudicaule]|uniref:F-box/LRR-repeat protein 15-like leucin rich repeat domain-containing protein n=1 Tax=Papaver nudicaule TaxID=74823 RepID=A0AA41S825_PAPNU|nr:hypothetical protein [Papaver nudicaule]
MMSLSSHSKHNQGLCKTMTSKSAQEGNDDEDGLKKGLTLIFKCLKTRDDRNSFGLTCRKWLDIQNNSQESLWYGNTYGSDKYSIISPENFPIVLCKLLVRFKNLKYLSLRGCPGMTGYVTSKSQVFGSKVQHLDLGCCFEKSDTEFSLIFSCFPSLTDISLKGSLISDKGLETLAKGCSSLETVNLSYCHSITDSGISSLIRNCSKLCSLSINYCRKITGIGFVECPKTLTRLAADGCKLNPEGIKAIVSGGGLEYLSLAATYESAKVINTEAVVTISKGCPLLNGLILSGCKEVELEGWQAIGQNCKHLEVLSVWGSTKLCDLGLLALCNGCDKLSILLIDDKISCSSSALELFNRKKPNVMHHTFDVRGEKFSHKSFSKLV